MSKYFLTGHKTGMWKKEKLSNLPSGGGNNDFVVNIVETESGDPPVYSYSAQHDGEPITIAQIYEAYQAGKTIKCNATYQGESIDCVCYVCSEYYVQFSAGFFAPEMPTVQLAFDGIVDDNVDTWFAYAKGDTYYTNVTDADLPEIYEKFSNSENVYFVMGGGKWPLTACEYNDTTQKYKAQFTVTGFLLGSMVGVAGVLFETGASPVSVISPITTIPVFDNTKAGYILKVNASGDGLEWVAP